jgi:hypothetical protein
MAVCTLATIARSVCPSGRAGIAALWVASADSVSALTFGSDNEVTAITMVSTEKFYKVDFEKNTGFFNQTVSRIKSNINVAQQISFVLPVMDKATHKNLRSIFECACGLIAIVKDNTGKFHMAGISTYPGSPVTFEAEQMRTGESTANTGADPTADSNEYVVVLEANTNWLAPFSTVAQGSIPV